MEEKPDIRQMGILIEVIDSSAIKAARTPNEAMDFVTLRKKEFCQIRTVLACYSRDERFFH
jgi:hypothetical protein